MNSMGAAREELVGLSTVSVLALIGFALYSTTYSLVYASSSSRPVVAVLEMWAVSLHLAASLACLVVHFVGMSVFEMQSRVSSILTSLFMGIAILSTVACSACLSLGEEKVCYAYFAAAAFPKFAAVGFCAWCWVMYVASLGGQAWSVGVSLGFSKMGSLTIASVILMVPYNIGTKLADTCQKTWLCGDGCIDYGIMIVIALSFVLMTAGEATLYVYTERLFKAKEKLKSSRQDRILYGVSFVARLLGCLTMIIGTLISMTSQPQSQYSSHVIAIVISCIPFTSILFFSETKKIKANAKSAGQQDYGYEQASGSEPAAVTTAINFQNFIQSNRHG